MSWFRDLRIHEEGYPVCKVFLTEWESTDGSSRADWTVEFPDSWEWSCCRQTDVRCFSTWGKAVTFANTKTAAFRDDV